MIDFRYYQILGAIHLGELHEAGRWLCAYELDSIKRNNPARIKKAHELRNLIKMINEEISGSVSASLVFDKSSISIVINGSRVSLSKRPLVFRLLEVLALHPEPQNLEKVFFAVYGTIYTQENHGRRFHSLLDRTRGLRNEKNWIIRSDGTLSLHPSIKTSFIGADASALVNHRRKQLKKMLPLYSKGASISDLEKSFNVTRRTIQSDLSTLSAKGEIVTTGITRNKRYSLGEISYA